ncbi:hypothetical protein A2165_01270 [Candidatus Curtissbacteria bacterium RBG_13_40_7]|uniref:Uncharacterized protein n=1 Tax=Candidatus Curtissbacteria bacterium RBG_13_40_7 TaxID=1797706 RepID=A0A1F5FUA8_9BACT|nr:MAG: hypothetical protein A2165_01270 [Candidatus Curtissbacteria bacterium RBG_13_40_7]
MSPDQFEQFLLGAAKFLLDPPNMMVRIIPDYEYSETGARVPIHTSEVTDMLGRHAIKAAKQEGVNITALLTSVLQITENDVSRARSLLNKSISPNFKDSYYRYAKSRQFIGLSSLWYPNEEQNRSLTIQLQELAFLVEVDLSNLLPGSKKFDQLILDAFPQVDLEIKILILAYIKDLWLRKQLSEEKIQLVAAEMGFYEDLYEEIKANDPFSPFVANFDAIRFLYELSELKEITKREQITPDELVDCFQRHTQLSRSLTVRELQEARDAAKDHRVALHLERILRERINA